MKHSVDRVNITQNPDITPEDDEKQKQHRRHLHRLIGISAATGVIIGGSIVGYDNMGPKHIEETTVQIGVGGSYDAAIQDGVAKLGINPEGIDVSWLGNKMQHNEGTPQPGEAIDVINHISALGLTSWIDVEPHQATDPVTIPGPITH